MEQSIELKLNSAGFKGEEIDEILPDFITERNTTIGLTWYPSVDGPESFTLIITVSILAAEFAKEFVKNLSKDLYSWTKEKVLPLLKRKQNPDGYVIIKLADVEIHYHDQSLFDEESGGLYYLDFLEKLPQLINAVDPSLGDRWEISFNQERGAWVVEPAAYLKA